MSGYTRTLLANERESSLDDIYRALANISELYPDNEALTDEINSATLQLDRLQVLLAGERGELTEKQLHDLVS